MMHGLREGMFLLAAATFAAPVMAQDSEATETTPIDADAMEATEAPKTSLTTPEAEPKKEEVVETSSTSYFNSNSLRRKPSTIFAFGLGQVKDLGEDDHYERLYGSPNKMGFIQTGYYLWSNVVDIGFSAKFGYYNAQGHPLTSLSGLSVPVKGNLPANVVLDNKQTVTLTMIPVQALLELAYSPFPVSRRITFRGWFGPEFLFVQEALKPNLPSTAAVPTGTSLVSKGWNQGLVTGAMISISINGIESRSDYALQSIGVDRTYVSPFMEIVKTTNDKMGNLDRKVYGINITFEGLR